jgi:CubicO group peptidase (beta-lactamase class C family)
MRTSIFTFAALFCLSCSSTKPLATKSFTAIKQGLITAVIPENAPTKKYSIEERMRFFNVPGVSIAVFEQGKLAWSKGYGLADVGRQQSVTPQTKFQAASISKAVTAFAVLKLVDQGKLNLDEDANQYLKDWKIPATEFTQTEKVTVRRLLNHTAGLTGEGFLGYKKSDKIPSATAVLNGEGRTPKITVAATPGSRFAYSGGGYLVLQKVIEDVSGQSFAEFMQQQVFAPLGMSNSTFNQFPTANVSLAYGSDGQVCEGGWLVNPELAPAGLWTTPTDLTKFCLAIQRAAQAEPKAVLSPKLVQAMLTPEQGMYGFGVMARGQGEARSFFHAGSNPGGYQSLMINYPGKEAGIVIMTNSSQGGTLRDEVFRAFAAHYGIDDNKPQQVKFVSLNKDELNAYTGRYQFEKMGNYYLEMSLDQSSGLVLLDPNDGKKNVFVPTGPESFIDVNSGEKAVFTKDAQTGKITGVLYNDSYVFKKLNQ